jgi:hypothetical protein
MNARRSPRPIFGNHAEDEFAQFPAHTSSAGTSAVPRNPLPVQLEAGAMPANDRLWLHENQCSLPSRPEPSQHHPEHLVGDGKTDVSTLPLQHPELLPESEIFEKQIAARMDGSDSQYKQEPQQAEHEASLTRKETRNWLHFYLTDCAADHNFGEAQVGADGLCADADDLAELKDEHHLGRIVDELDRGPQAQRVATIHTRPQAGLNSLEFPFSPSPGHFPANMAGIYSYPENAAPEKTAWRKRRDSNPRYPFRYASFQDWSHQPLGHSSAHR